MANKKLFFDARYIRIDHHDGISRFSSGLAAALNKITNITFLISDLRQLDQLPQGIKFVKISSPTSIFEPLVAKQINKLHADVVFSPMQTMGSLGRKYKLILTLHDLIYYLHPTPPPAFNVLIRILWRLYHLTYLPQRFLLNRADLVATVSETTAGLILKHRLTSKPVEVIYNAADEAPLERSRESAASKNLIYMGSFMSYKNVETLIKGMEFLPDFNLQLLSRISDTRLAELKSLVKPAGGSIEFINGVSDEEYHRLLNESFALVSASLDEGFGIPLVEAMTRGIPVVASDLEIFREVCGNAAVFFAPTDSEEFANKIKSLEDTERWLHLSNLATAQAAKFDWELSAKRLLAAMLRV